MLELRVLSLHKKLLLILAIPIVGLVVFASEAIVSRNQVVSQMDHLRALVGLGVSTSNLIHEIQRERGRSSGYLASEGARLGNELRSQQAATDQMISQFRDGLDQLESDDEELSLASGRIMPLLDQIASHRESISNRSASPTQAISFYSQINRQLIGLIIQIAKATSGTHLTQQLIVLNYLVELKELRGVERGLVNGMLSTDSTTDEIRQELTRNLNEQNAIYQLLVAYAVTEQAEQIRHALSGQEAETVRRIRERLLQPSATRAEAEFSPEAPPRPPPPPAEGDAAALGSQDPTAAAVPVTTASATADAPQAPVGPKLTLDAALAETWWGAATTVIDRLAEVEDEFSDEISTGARDLREEARSSAMLYLIATIAVAIGAGSLSWFISRSISRALAANASTAREIADQITQATSQQAESTQSTATSVAETTTTVDEIRQTSEGASKQAERVANDAESNIAAAAQTREAVEHGLEAMQLIRQEVEGIARNILELSEKNLQIGEIVQTVNGLAEQSNLLAVNASIEAAKAGEHGRGFSVVASEVKILAGRSKDATEQIRSILSDIQKSSNAAVMITEQGVKRVEEGQALVEELGRTIQALGNVIESNVDSARQISMTSKQQLAGVEQINQAMQALEEGTKGSAASAAQLTTASKQVRMVSDQLTALVKGGA